MWIFIVGETCVGEGKLKTFGFVEILRDLVTESRRHLFQGTL